MALDYQNVCLIIESCAKNGVYLFKLGDLEVHLGVKPSAPGPAILESHPEKIIQEQIKQEKEAIEDEEIRTKESQIEELLITDPFKAEELILQGDLVPGEDDAGNDEREDE
jgi:hypothetical protein